MSGSNSESDPLGKLPDFIWIMMLDQNRESVLVVRKDGDWELPMLQHQHSMSDSNRITRCQQDLQRLLQTPQAQFAFIVELLGTRLVSLPSDAGEHIGFPKLLLVELLTDSCSDDVCLPSSFAWKNCDEVRSILSKKTDFFKRHVLHRVIGCMDPKKLFLSSLRDPRYQVGWYQSASEFLTSVVTLDGVTAEAPVVQHHLTTTSSLLKVHTSAGWYFLKSPAIGCAEVTISERVASLFPEYSPRVLQSSTELNCFVMKGFEHRVPDHKSLSELVKKLACLQLKSIKHVAALSQVGCPVRKPNLLIKNVKKWAEGIGVTMDCTEAQEYCTHLLPYIGKMLSILERSTVPHTLLHGDFYYSNAVLIGEGNPELIFFDWQFAHIGHPFMDFHRIHKECSQQVIDEYLKLWTSFGTLDDLRETFRTTWKLGWLFKLWSLSEWYDACNPQWSSSLQYWMLNTLRSLHKSVLEEPV